MIYKAESDDDSSWIGMLYKIYSAQSLHATYDGVKGESPMHWCIRSITHALM